MKNFDYKDSFVAVREWETGIIPDRMQRTCFCCGEKINRCMKRKPKKDNDVGEDTLVIIANRAK